MDVRVSELVKTFGRILELVETGKLDPAHLEHCFKALERGEVASNHLHVLRHGYDFVVAVHYGLGYKGDVDGALISPSREQAQDFLDHSNLTVAETFRLRMLFGIDDPLGRPATIEEVARYFGLTEGGAKHSIRQALTKIRQAHNITAPPK